MPDSSDAFPVAVIGAGLAGLTAAVHLADRGIPPLVLEADSEWPGGRLCGGAPDTFKHEGRTWAFPSEHGVHALWGNYDNMRATIERFTDLELLPSEEEEWIDRLNTKVWIASAGKAIRKTWLPAPFHYLQLLFKPRFWKTIALFDLLSFFGFVVSVLLTLGIDPIMEQKAWDGLLFKEYFRGWTRNLRETFIGLGRNLLAAPEEEITLAGFIAAIRFFTMLRRDSWHPCYLPANPHTCLIRPLIERIEHSEGMVMPGARVLELEKQGDLWRIQVEDARRGKRSVLAKQIILAVDAPAAEKILTGSPATQPEAAEMIFPGALPGASVRLWFDNQPRDGAPGGMFTGHCFADNFFWMHRLHEEFREWGENGGSAIEMHLYAPAAELKRPDQVLMAQAAVDVYQAFPEMRGHLVYGVVRHNEATQTRFRVPTAESLHVDTPWQGMYACGDWIGYPSPAMWMERCSVTGIAAANRILESQGKQPYDIISPRQPEWLVRVIIWLLTRLRWLLRPLFTIMRRAGRRKIFRRKPE